MMHPLLVAILAVVATWDAWRWYAGRIAASPEEAAAIPSLKTHVSERSGQVDRHIVRYAIDLRRLYTDVTELFGLSHAFPLRRWLWLLPAQVADGWGSKRDSLERAHARWERDTGNPSRCDGNGIGNGGRCRDCRRCNESRRERERYRAGFTPHFDSSDDLSRSARETLM